MKHHKPEPMDLIPLRLEAALAVEWRKAAKKEGHTSRLPGYSPRYGIAVAKRAPEETLAMMIDCASRGMSLKETAEAMDRSPATIHKAAKRAGITFSKDGRERDPVTGVFVSGRGR